MTRCSVAISLALAALCLNCSGVEKHTRELNLPAHHTSDGFRNPHQTEHRGFTDFLRWQFGRGPQDSTTIPLSEIPKYQPEIVPPDLTRIAEANSGSIRLTWIGHATFLIQVDGMNILSDPIFSKRCSPVSFAGPARYVEPGIGLEDLPEIHAVIISHNHYDHLDEDTIEKLGNKPRYFVPLGLKAWFASKGVTNVIELDWWDSVAFRQVVFDCVPTQHFSGRSLFDRDETLWCGWVLQSRNGNVFFAGDTGYSPDFKEIGRRFQSIKLALIPIGAYRPRWFMGPVHVDPPEAVKIHQDVRAEYSVAMHWGTFKLADEPMAEPPIYLKTALAKANLSEERFVVMKFGETRRF